MLRERSAFLNEQLRHLRTPAKETEVSANGLGNNFHGIARRFQYAIHLGFEFLQAAFDCREEELILGGKISINGAIPNTQVIGDRLNLCIGEPVSGKDASSDIQYL